MISRGVRMFDCNERRGVRIYCPMDVFERATALARCGVLAPVPAAAVLALAERATTVRVAAGEPLPVRTGGGDAVLVVVTEGAARLVGELAAIDEDAAPPAETATEPTLVLRVHRDDFLDLLAEHPAAARALARDLAGRLRGDP
jgi:CRP-like cAMP-binding protein